MGNKGRRVDKQKLTRVGFESAGGIGQACFRIVRVIGHRQTVIFKCNSQLAARQISLGVPTIPPLLAGHAPCKEF